MPRRDKLTLRQRMKFESLEQRQCLAASVTNIGNFNDTDPFGDIRLASSTGDYVYFLNGQTIIRTDGTTSGTVELADVGTNLPNPQFTGFNGATYFQGYDATNGFELWRSDGTVAGTALVKNVSSNTTDQTISSLTVFSNRLYFVSQGELFSTDGTATGTIQTIDLVPAGSDGIANLSVHNSALYFSAQSKLYKSDGTGAGTSQLTSSPTGVYSLLTSTPGGLYFNAGSLWRFNDATQEFIPIGGVSNSLAAVNGSVFFSTGETLWKTDGSANAALEVASPENISNLTNFQGVLYFAAGVSVYGPGVELWRSDGTVAGTFMIKDVEPQGRLAYGYLIGESSNPSHFTNFNGQLYFQTSSSDGDSSPANGIWKTDGTAAGTVQVVQGLIHAFTKHNDQLYVGTNAANGIGHRLMRLDQNEIATDVQRDGTGIGSFSLGGLVNVNGRYVLFGNTGAVGHELYQLNSDNTVTLVKDITPGETSTNISIAVVIGNLYYFATFSFATGQSNLYRTDGTPEGTFLLKSFSHIDGIQSAGSQVFIAVRDATDASQLWKTDGSVAGTVLVKNIGPGIDQIPTDLRDLTEFNGKLYFSAVIADKRSMWVSDGTSAGTKEAINLGLPNARFSVGWTKEFQSKLYFIAAVGNGLRIYKSDGSQSGTSAVSTTSFKRVGHSGQAAVVGNILYFTAETTAYGIELWKIAGNSVPQLVKDVYPGVNSSGPSNFKVANNKLYFSANSPATGSELWESSGTSATTLALDINIGPSASDPSVIGSMNGVLFISANDGVHGTELWQTNGAAAGVTLVKDIVPGPVGTSPRGLGIRGGEAIIAAFTNELGFELWSVRSSPPVMTLPTQAADYREAGPVVRLAPQALLDDSDNPVLLGAALKVSLGSSFRAGDQVLLTNTSTVSFNNNTVLVSGTAIGTFATSGAGKELSVVFNQNATRARVREVVRAVAFNHTTASPVPGQRSIRFELNDGSSGQATPRVVRIEVVPLDTLPVISGLPSSATSTLGSTGFAFASTAVITDDNFNLAGGELVVHFNNSRDNTRILISLGGPTFWKDSANNVYKGSVQIGTMNAGGGVGTTAMRITFNDKVTPAIAQELLRSLKLSTPGSTTAGVRIPWIRISDGSRGYSEIVTRPYVSVS